MELRNVKIGDKFKNGKYLTAEVIDFYEVKSLTTGEIIKYECIAKSTNEMTIGTFSVPFTTVLRNKIL
jgi:hypothetical protein